MVSARATFLALAVLGAAGCGVIAGLPSDYGLADASPDADAGRDADAMATLDGPVAFDANGDASAGDAAADSPALDAPADTSSADVGEAGPRVPSTDPANVACGSAKCPVSSKVCCEQQGATSCVDNQNPTCNGGGVVAECDEAANCGSAGDLCCVTGVRSFGLETQCHQTCNGRGPQSCRKDSECSGQTCVAWMCAGRTVATCGGAGADAGCN